MNSIGIELVERSASTITLKHTLMLNGKRWEFSKEIQLEPDLSSCLRHAKGAQLQASWVSLIQENGAQILQSLDEDFLERNTTFYVKVTDQSVDVYTRLDAGQAERSLAQETPLFQTLQKTNNFSIPYLTTRAQETALKARLIGLQNPQNQCFVNVAFQAIASNPHLQESANQDPAFKNAFLKYQEQLTAENPEPIDFQSFIAELQQELHQDQVLSLVNLGGQEDPRQILPFLLKGTPLFDLFEKDISSLELNGTPETLFIFSNTEKPLAFSKNNATYTLQSFGVHSGSANRGHHILYLRKEDGTCWCLDDAIIYQVSENEFSEQAKHGIFFNYNREELGLADPVVPPEPALEPEEEPDEQDPLLPKLDDATIEKMQGELASKSTYFWKRVTVKVYRNYLKELQKTVKNIDSLTYDKVKNDSAFIKKLWKTRLIYTVLLVGLLGTIWDLLILFLQPLIYGGKKISNLANFQKTTKKAKRYLVEINNYQKDLPPGNEMKRDAINIKKEIGAALKTKDLKALELEVARWETFKKNNQALAPISK